MDVLQILLLEEGEFNDHNCRTYKILFADEINNI